jgi:branched-chain amino acid aminotransferase
VNGERNASVSVHDRGVTLADGVFETMHVRRGTPFRLDRHLARLRRGLVALEIPDPPALDDWLRGAVSSESTQAVSEGDVSLRVTVTRGVGPSGVGVPAVVHPTVIVTLSAMPVFAPSTYDKGLTVHVASGRRNERSATAGLKTLAYIDAIAGLLEARRAGADEALFLDTENHCSEASASNLFVWTGSLLLTPPLSCGVLPGVTREAVLELARVQGLDTVERAFGLEELRAGAEAFLTSSLRGLAPVVRVGADTIGRGTPGPITTRLATEYRTLVDRECSA